MNKLVDAVLFDVGGVLVTDGPELAAVARHLGLPADAAGLESVHNGVWAARDAYDLGSSDADYWRQVARLAGAEPPAATVIETLTADDTARWSNPVPAVVDLISDLLAGGVPVGILSNAPHAFAAALRSLPWATELTATIFSCEVGVAKPDPAIYLAAAAAINHEPGRTLFFDDRSRNIVGAHQVGMRAALWQDADQGRAELRSLGLAI